MYRNAVTTNVCAVEVDAANREISVADLTLGLKESQT